MTRDGSPRRDEFGRVRKDGSYGERYPPADENDRRENNGNHYGPAHSYPQDDDVFEGLVIKGEVVRIESYGAFLDFRDPKYGKSHRGLAHISQLAEHRVEDVSEVLKLRDEVYAVVLEVEPDQRRKRIRLSLKGVDQKTGKYRGPDLKKQPRRGRPPPQAQLQRRAEQRRDMYLSCHIQWEDGSKQARANAPDYLRTLWSSSPEPPSQSESAPVKKKARDPSPGSSSSASSSSDASTASSSSSSSGGRNTRRKKRQSRSKRDQRRRESRSRKGRRNSRRSKRRRYSSSSDSSSSSSESSSGSSSSGSSFSSSSRRSGAAKKSKEAPPDDIQVDSNQVGQWDEADLRDAEDLKKAVQRPSGSDDEDEEGPMPLPNSNAAGGDAAASKASYGKALLPGEGQAIAQYVQQNLRIPRRGEIGYSGGDIEQFEKSGYVMSGSRHTRMNAVRIRKENQVYSAEEQRALALITMEENQQKESQLMEDFRTMLKEKQKIRQGKGQSS